MSELRSALNGAHFDGYVLVSEGDPRGMIQLRADLGQDAVASAVQKVTGASLPQPLGHSQGERGEVLWMSPDELLILLPPSAVGNGVEALERDLDGLHHLAVDVSDLRAEIRLEGAAVREVLAKVAPVDMAQLEVGTVRRTRIGQVPAAMWLSDAETAHVLCFRSVAAYVFGVLSVSARKGGEVGAF